MGPDQNGEAPGRSEDVRDLHIRDDGGGGRLDHDQPGIVTVNPLDDLIPVQIVCGSIYQVDLEGATDFERGAQDAGMV